MKRLVYIFINRIEIMRRQPKITKYGKQFKGGKSRGVTRSERRRGSLGLRARTSGRITLGQRETIRRNRGQHRRRNRLQGIVKGRRKGKAEIPVTSKARGVRMGKGKGSVSYWAKRVRRGDRRLERRISGSRKGKEKKRSEILKKVGHKRPRITKVRTESTWEVHG